MSFITYIVLKHIGTFLLFFPYLKLFIIRFVLVKREVFTILTFFDKFQNQLFIVVLLLYIFNSVYVGSEMVSVLLFFAFITIQLICLRKHIGKLTFIQKAMILAIVSLAILFLVLAFMLLNHLIDVGYLSYTDWTVGVIQITLIVTFLLVVTSSIRVVYRKYTSTNA